ncbi:flavodoxin family protein [Serratia marcescens]|nr:flavodoxin family protein [Serratia marcescens]MBH2866122.1 flavodoxin family protein [Serratia marcescens]MBW4238440.1 flavodoxin family protein [Enterobacter roggenkampii]
MCETVFSPCDGCGIENLDCNYRNSPCEKDDQLPKIIDLMVKSDIIIYATPVHAFGICHLMQIFLERAGVGYLRFKRPLANKIGGCIIVGGKYHLGHAHDQIMNNMLLNRMIVPGSGFPVLIHGNEDTKELDDVEEEIALEQMVNRLIKVHSSIDFKKLSQNWENERNLKTLKEINK